MKYQEVVVIKQFLNGSIIMTKKQIGRPYMPIAYTEKQREYCRWKQRRWRLKKQFESLHWLYAFTLTLGLESERADVRTVLKKAKKFLKQQNVDYFLVAQTPDNQTPDGKWEWHIHGVCTKMLDLDLWCDLAYADFCAQDCVSIRPNDLDIWFNYMMRKLQEDTEKSDARLTATTCKPQNKCTPKTTYLKCTSEVDKICRENQNRTVRNEEAFLLEKELEAIKHNQDACKNAVTNGQSSSIPEKGLNKMLPLSRNITYAREGATTSTNTPKFTDAGGLSGRRHNKEIPVFWRDAYEKADKELERNSLSALCT